jgi:hypothetical protein
MLTLLLMSLAAAPASDLDFRCEAGDPVFATKAALPVPARLALRHLAERGQSIVAPDIHSLPGEGSDAPSKAFVSACRRGDLIAVEYRDARRGYGTAWLVLRKDAKGWRQVR